MGGRCPRLERLEFGLLNRRPSFRAPDWVEINFRTFCLRGKGLERERTELAAMHEPPAVQPSCHVTGPSLSSYEDRPAGLHGPFWSFARDKYKFPNLEILWHGLCN